MEQTLLLLLRDAMGGRGPGEDTRLALKSCHPEQILALAEQHNIIPLVGPLLLKGDTDLPEPEKLRQILRAQVIRQVLSTDALCQITTALDEGAIDYLVVKGAACRSLYPEPDHRPSTDEDILVRPEDRTRAEQVLLQLGYTTGMQEAEDQVWHFHNGQLHVELHQALTRRPELERRFQDCLKMPECFQVEGYTLKTLPPREHFLFLAEHFYKHFIHGGVGIRQVADMVLLVKKTELDMPELWQDLEDLGLERLVAGLLEIGINHLDLPPERAAIPAPIKARCPGYEALLEDILDAGVFGASSRERLHSGTMTAQTLDGKTPSMVRTLFPGKNELKGRYPYLIKRPWLLPVAWSQRIYGYIREDRSAISRASDSRALGKQRLKLMADYGLTESGKRV